MNLDDKGRCCGRKPLTYRTAQDSFVKAPYHFCCRCDRSYDMDGAQIENWAWVRKGDEFAPRERDVDRLREDRDERRLLERESGE